MDGHALHPPPLAALKVADRIEQSGKAGVVHGFSGTRGNTTPRHRGRPGQTGAAVAFYEDSSSPIALRGPAPASPWPSQRTTLRLRSRQKLTRTGAARRRWLPRSARAPIYLRRPYRWYSSQACWSPRSQARRNNSVARTSSRSIPLPRRYMIPKRTHESASRASHPAPVAYARARAKQAAGVPTLQPRS